MSNHLDEITSLLRHNWTVPDDARERFWGVSVSIVLAVDACISRAGGIDPSGYIMYSGLPATSYESAPKGSFDPITQQ